MRSEHLLRLSRSSAPVGSVAPVDFAAPPACAIVHEQPTTFNAQHANLATILANKCAARQSRNQSREQKKKKCAARQSRNQSREQKKKKCAARQYREQKKRNAQQSREQKKK